MRPRTAARSWSSGISRRWPAPAALVVVAIALVLDAVNRYEPIGIDFHTYLAAAVVGVQHGWSHIYDQDLVAAAQKQLVPAQIAQPFLSPPTDAWLTAPLTALPYWVAYWVWVAVNLSAFVAALVWASRSRGLERWVIAGAAIAPWWVLHATNLGQVAPLVATGAVLATRFARDGNDIAAGLALSLLYLKPNTAFLVPVALLAAGRYRIFAVWAAAGLLIAAGALGSLLTVPYLHGSDLCLFSAAAWIVWDERIAWSWRLPLAASWVVATPYVNSTSLALRLNRWTLFEAALLIALAVSALWPRHERATALVSASES